jgi:3D (Asp-Asp-Asp) domain-containing protein
VLRLIRASLISAVIVVLIDLGGAVPSVPASPRRRHFDTRPGATVPFTATAYCQSGVTRSGASTHSGIAAADPSELPVGSVVHIQTRKDEYDGIYTVLDTGTKVQGRKVDLFMHDCGEAQQFGRQPARVTVLRRGWSPKATAPAPVMAGIGER